MRSAWIEKWLGRSQTSQSRRPPRRRRSTQLCLEQLEQRSLPSITTLASLMDAPGGGEPTGGLTLDSSGNLFGTTMRGGAFGDGTIFEVQKESNAVTIFASFNGTNGAQPNGSLVADSSDDLFGTTSTGGILGYGTVFEVHHGSGTITTLAAFNGFNGASPIGGLTVDSSGNLFGTTFSGGTGWDPTQPGRSHGVVFEVVKDSGIVTVVASFDLANGSIARGGVIEDSNGDLFGTTEGNASFLWGTVFEVQRGTGAITTVASFTGLNGADPMGGLIEDASGNLFGTTSAGGFGFDFAHGQLGWGTIFEISHDSGSITTLVAFDDTTGGDPSANLFEDSSGNFFGTTAGGGAFPKGTVFELPQGSETVTTLAAFSSANAGDQAGVVRDSSGNLFGASSLSPASEGIIFELEDDSGTITTLASFRGTTGYQPWGGAVMDGSGNLFSTTYFGGTYGYGTVFEVQKGSGSVTTLVTFDGENGAHPQAGLTVDSNGNLFGTTSEGGAFNWGTVFEVQKGTGAIKTLATFNFANGAAPHATLLEDGSGNLFGTTTIGGAFGGGTVFELPAGSNTITTLANLYGPTGANPSGTLVEDASGNLFGSTSSGGQYGLGTVFELAQGTGGITTLAAFTYSIGGGGGALVGDRNGDLFGVAGNEFIGGNAILFEVPKGSSSFLTLASFTDHSAPNGPLLEDGEGNLFGTTQQGGTSDDGTVFELKQGSGTITTLAAFNGANGAFPFSGLIEDNSGNFYGTTYAGGASNDGAVFELPPPVNLPTGTAGLGYSQTLSGLGGTGTATFTTSGTLPAGLALSSSGVLSGIPTAPGSYTFLVTATDAMGASTNQDYSITVVPGKLSQYVVTLAGSIPNGVGEYAGVGFVVSVQGADAYGNPVSSYSGPSTVTATLRYYYSQVPVTTRSVSLDSSGFGYFLETVQGADTYQIVVSAGSLSGSSVRIFLIEGQAVKLSIGGVADTPSGVILHGVSVQIQDAYGNRVWADSTDTVTLGLASGPGAFTAASTLTAPVVNGVATFNNLTLVVPGTYTLSALVPGKYTGPNSTAFTVAPLQVVPGSLTSTPSGFSLSFNGPYLVNSTTPVLYGRGFGATAPMPTVTLTRIKDALGHTVDVPVAGSLVLSPGVGGQGSGVSGLTFVATDTSLEADNGSPVLPDGTYRVVMHGSAITDGFQALNPGGGFLDGLGTGNPGSGDFTTTFTVSTAGQDVVWIPDTADGPGQPLEAPGMNQAGGGYPVYLDDSTGNVTSVQVTMNYNPNLLTVTGVSRAGFSLLGTSTPGKAVLQYSGPALPAGSQTPIGYLLATVPAGTPASPTPYKAKDLLHLTNVLLNDGTIPATTGDALHLVAYVGDANGDGTYSSADALLVTRAALQLDSGFAAYPLVDPVIVADTDGVGYIPPDAGLQVNEAGVGFPTTNLSSPPIPSGVHFQAIANNVDPTLSLVAGDGWRVAGTVNVAVNLDDAHPEGSTGLIRGHLALTYDPRLFTVTAADVHAGSLLAGGDWQVVPTIDQTTGQIAVTFSGDTAIASALSGSLVTIAFHPIAGEPDRSVRNDGTGGRPGHVHSFLSTGERRLFSSLHHPGGGVPGAEIFRNRGGHRIPERPPRR